MTRISSNDQRLFGKQTEDLLSQLVSINESLVSTDTPPELFADVATTTALPTCTYAANALTASVNGSLGTIDGVTMVVGHTILVKNQASTLQNGLYEVTQLGDGSNPWILTRLTTYNETAEVYPSAVTITQGTANYAQYYIQSTVSPTVGTDSIVYTLGSRPVSPNYPVQYVHVHTETVLPYTPTYTSGTSSSIPAYGATYNATSNGAFPTLQGVSPYVGMYVLVKDQADATKNGTYRITDKGSASRPYKLTRVAYSSAGLYGHIWHVMLGTSKGQMFWQSTSNLSNTLIGTTGNIVFENIQGNMPSYTTAQRDALTGMLAGTFIFNSTTGVPNYYNGSAWTTIGATTIYSGDGTLSGNRTVTSGGYRLDFTGATPLFRILGTSSAQNAGININTSAGGTSPTADGFAIFQEGVTGKYVLQGLDAVDMEFRAHLGTTWQSIGYNGGVAFPGASAGNGVIIADNATNLGTNTTLQVKSKGTTSSYYPFVLYGMAGTTGVGVRGDGNMFVGTTDYTESARFSVKGSGSTSATVNTLHNNSSGTELFKLLDDGTATFDNEATISGLGSGLLISHKDNHTTSSYALYQPSTGYTTINAKTGQHVRFSVNNTEYARLDANGFGIGTTADATYQFRITGNNIRTGKVEIGDLGGDLGIARAGQNTATNYTIFSSATVTHINSPSTYPVNISSNNVTKVSVKATGVLRVVPITATAASALTPEEGDIVMVSDTNGTFTTIGFWGYQNGAWTKM